MSEPLKSPTSYSDWVTCFNLLVKGEQDEELLDVIVKGKVPWTKGIAERFVRNMTSAISTRLQVALEDFNKQLGRANREENEIVQAILTLRRRSQYLLRFVNTSVFPQEVQTNFTQEIEKNLHQIQELLLDETKKDPSGRLLRIVQHTPILVKEQLSKEKTTTQTGKTKRRIIF